MAKNGVDEAIDKLKAQIGDLERSIDALLLVRGDAAPEPKKRGRKPKKMGLPQADTGE